jgi:hypothetical protein
MLDPKVVAHHSVETSTSVIEIIVGEHDEDGILPLLTPDQDGISTEQLESFHGVV